MGDSEEEVSPSSKRVAKKKYFPFGTPSHLNHAFSQFSHLNTETKGFAIGLATATDVEAEVIEVKPQRRVVKRPPKPSMSSALGSKSADELDPVNDGIPDAEGMEPCKQLPCQQVVKAIIDLQYQNEVERDEIEEEYQRLLLELEVAQKRIVTEEEKLVQLNEIGNQLEQRHNKLIGNVETLEATREALHTERSDINNKVMVLETEKQKCNRALEKAEKTLATAIWRKKNEEHQQNIELGLSIGGSEISEQVLVHNDAASVASFDSTYQTPYSRLAQTKVVDVIEMPPPVTTLTPYLVERIQEYPHHFDKYSISHYKKQAKRGVESWKSMEGSLLTGSIYSASSHGNRPEDIAASYDEYTTLRANQMFSASSSSGANSPKSPKASSATSRVGSLLKSRTGVGMGGVGSPMGQSAGRLSHSHSGSLKGALRDDGTLSAPNSRAATHSAGSGSGGRHRRSRGSAGSGRGIGASASTGKLNKNQVRLTPLPSTPGKDGAGNGGNGGARSNQGNGGIATVGIGEAGIDGGGADQSVGDPSVTGLGGALAGSSLSTLSAEGGTYASEEDYRSKLDPVFYSDASRAMWGRKSKVGKVRTMEVGWGMLSHKKALASDSEKQAKEKAEEEAQSKLTASERRRLSKLSDTKKEEPTVKPRALTMYHPKMDVFRDSFTLSNR